MSTNFHHSNLSEQFKKVVSDGIATGDFSELNILINDTVSDVISEAGRQIKNAGSTTSKIYEGAHQYEEQQKLRNEKFKKTYQSAGILKKGFPGYSKTTLPAVKTKNVGQVSSVLYTVFGGIGTFLTSSILIGTILASIFGTGIVWSEFYKHTILWAIFLFILYKGITEKKRLSRMKRYLSLFADKMYVNIADLAQNVGKSAKYVLKDVKKMLSLGFFPEGHLDKKETCLMLDDNTYREYLKIEKQRQAYELEQAQTSQQSAKTESATDSSNTQATKQPPVNPELQTMIREGQSYIRRLRELNDLIPGEVISDKLYRMETLLKEIFKRLEEDPSQMSQLHKLMNYYLPTTIKLLQSYAEFDDISAPGKEIINAKAEIEKTVDTINEAFAELLNKLFQATIFDVTTDAQVLQTMLAKEGLTKNDFSED